jgi:glutamyl-tRNA synthetase
VTPFAAKELDAAAGAFLRERSLELKDMAQPARVALTGRSASPGLFEVAELLGKERASLRLEAAADRAERSA